MKTGKTVTVCINRRSNPEAPSCGARGAEEIALALEAAIAGRNLPLTVERFKCLGMCERGPNLKLSPGGEFLHGMRLEDLPRIMEIITEFSRS